MPRQSTYTVRGFLSTYDKTGIGEDVRARLIASLARVSGRGWLTRLVDVNATTHAKLIFLDLKHTPAPMGKGKRRVDS